MSWEAKIKATATDLADKARDNLEELSKSLPKPRRSAGATGEPKAAFSG